MYEGNWESDNNNNSTKRSERQCYKSPWMSHWMKPNHSNVAVEARNHTELDFAPRGDSGLKELETRGFRILNDSLRTGSLRDGNESLFKIDVQDRGKGLISHNKFDLFSKSYRDEGTSKNPIGWITPRLPAIDDGVADDSMSLKGFLAESSCREVDQGKATVLSLMSGGSANVRNLEQGNCHNGVETQFIDVPSTSGLHLQQFNQGWLQKMQNCANIGLFPMQFIASDETKTKDLQKFPEVVDMETMRICTMLDSVVGMPGGCPVFSQTTHSMLFTKKTDASSSKENEIFRNTKVVNEKASEDHCGLSSFFGKGKQGLILQSLSSSADSEGKGNMGHVKASKVTIRNESSAETHTLDMDNLKEKNQQTDTNSSASIKIGATGSRETGLPDMNLPAGPAPASLSENADPSSSRTQSLDIDLLIPHAEHPKPTFNPNMDSSMKPDPNNRWVKRLKVNSSSALSTKSSKLSDILSHEKMSSYFSRILKNNITSSEDLLDSGCELSKEDGGVSMDLAKKDTKVLLSQTWIQRWLSDESRATQTKPGNSLICQPLSSKMELEDLEKKQFPSIAAMALMGKAMSGSQPCELQKRGSFTVWNTKAF